MKKLLIILVCFCFTPAFADSHLPQCEIKESTITAHTVTVLTKTACYGSVTFTNGDKYVGEWKDGNFNGQGTFTFHDGGKYVGEWKDGKWHGQGIITFIDGGKYVGEFKDNKLNGQGTRTHADGNKYEGEWKNGLHEGQGTYIYANGEKYVGEWKIGKHHGQGTFNFNNGDKYVGEFSNNIKHGLGTYSFSNGDKYVGEFKDNNFNGQGTITYVVGGSYVGEWKKSYKHGKGTNIYANGEKYVGEWKIGKHHGQGTFNFNNGDKYVGEFSNGIRHGQGTYTFAAGGRYVGEWKEGKKHGFGNTIHPPKYEGLTTGDKYVGEYRDGKRHGFGTYTFINGKKKIGEWKNNKFVKSNFGYKDFMFGMPRKYVLYLDVCEGVDENAICYDKKNWRFNFSYTSENRLQNIVIDLGIYEEESWNDIKDKIEEKYKIDFELCKKLFFSCSPKQLKLFLNLKTDYFAYSFHKGHVLLKLIREEENIEQMQVGYYNDELAKQNLENYEFIEEVSADDF